MGTKYKIISVSIGLMQFVLTGLWYFWNNKPNARLLNKNSTPTQIQNHEVNKTLYKDLKQENLFFYITI